MNAINVNWWDMARPLSIVMCLKLFGDGASVGNEYLRDSGELQRAIEDEMVIIDVHSILACISSSIQNDCPSHSHCPYKWKTQRLGICALAPCERVACVSTSFVISAGCQYNSSCCHSCIYAVLHRMVQTVTANGCKVFQGETINLRLGILVRVRSSMQYIGISWLVTIYNPVITCN